MYRNDSHKTTPYQFSTSTDLENYKFLPTRLASLRDQTYQSQTPAKPGNRPNPYQETAITRCGIKKIFDTKKSKDMNGKNHAPSLVLLTVFLAGRATT